MKFLRQDGWFQPVAGADIVTSTATTTGFLTYLTKSTTADISMTTTGYFDGPTVTQGTTGTWFVSGTVSLVDTNNVQFFARLWDGTNNIASTKNTNFAANQPMSLSVSGISVNPAGNLRISVAANGITGTILFNVSGFSNDSTITAIRIG